MFLYQAFSEKNCVSCFFYLFGRHVYTLPLFFQKAKVTFCRHLPPFHREVLRLPSLLYFVNSYILYLTFSVESFHLLILSFDRVSHLLFFLFVVIVVVVLPLSVSSLALFCL